MDFSLVTLRGVKYKGSISELLLRTTDGDIVIMPQHEALTAIVKPGPLVIRTKDNKEEIFAIFGGLLDISGNEAKLISDEVDHIDDIVESNIKEAIQRAETIKKQSQDKAEINLAERDLDRHAIRLDVYRLKRRHHKKY